jgi:hypothetical protein
MNIKDMIRTPPLIGPIPTGASFMIVSIQNGLPYILNTSSSNGNIIYYWEQNLEKVVADSSMGVFTSHGTVDSLTITDTVNGGGLGFESGNNILSNESTSAHISMIQSLYATWWPPDVLLSDVVYTMNNASNGSEAVILTTSSGTGPTTPANNIIILPVLWYNNCTSSGSYDLINQPIDSVVNWFCVTNSSGTGCSGIPILKNGWTNLPDCVVGNFYSYCLSGDTCGTNSCNGPCSVIYDDCTFSSSSNNFSCVFNPEKFINDTKWWQSPYFIGAIIAILLIIFAIIIVIFVAIRRRRTSVPPVNY